MSDLQKATARVGATRSQGILLIATCIQAGMTLILTIFLARVLDPTDFGFFALIATVLLLGRELLDLGTANVAARETAKAPEREVGLLSVVLSWRYMSGIVLALAIAAMAFSYEATARRIVLLIAAAVVAILAPGVLYSIFQVRQRQGGPAVISIAGHLGLLSATVFAWIVKWPAIVFALLLVIREAAILLILRWWGHRLLGVRVRPGWRELYRRQIITASLIYGGAVLLYMLHIHGDVLFVLWLRGDAELGAFASAARLFQPAHALSWALMTPIIPIYAAMLRRGGADVLGLSQRIITLMLAIGLVAAVAGGLLAKDIIELLYGDRYIAGLLNAVDVFRWFSVATAAAIVIPACAAHLLADGRERILLFVSGIGLVINIVGNLISIPRFGIAGAAASTAVAQVFTLLMLACCLGHMRSLPSVIVAMTRSAVPAATVAVILVLAAGRSDRLIYGVLLVVLATSGILLSRGARKLRCEIAEVERRNVSDLSYLDQSQDKPNGRDR